MEHLTKFERGYDCIKFECIADSKACVPKQGGSHGVHGMTIRFISKGEKGAVVFTLYTGWLPQRKSKDSIGYLGIREWGDRVMPADLGYHSMTPKYEGQSQSQEHCEFLDGKPCYYDGSGLNAEDAMYSLVNGGDEGLWKFLDGYYMCTFEGADYPPLVEYAKQLRK